MMQYWIGGVDSDTLKTWSKGNKMHHITAPGTKAYICDSVFSASSPLPSWNAEDTLPTHGYGYYMVVNTGNYSSRRRHGRRLNMLFADGHIAAMTNLMLQQKNKPQYYSSEMFGNKGFK